jgi:hypothetical protein
VSPEEKKLCEIQATVKAVLQDLCFALDMAREARSRLIEIASQLNELDRQVADLLSTLRTRKAER